MTYAIFARLGAAAAACGCACLLSASAASADGGGASYGDPAPAPAPAAAAPAAAPSTAAAPATGDGGTLLVSTAAILGRTLHVRGSLAQGTSGRGVIVQRQRKDGTWSQAATATTTDGGAFDATWKTDHIGRFALRAIAAPTAGAASASTPRSTGVTPVTVYRQYTATFYGEGFFGQKTACGQVLQPDTLGVAHRGLPCGTQVAIYYKGRTVTVPVIDRGPFANGATWDLTEAAATAVGMTGTAQIGAVRLPKAAAPAG